MGLDFKPSKVFYGWWIVGAGFFISLYVGGTIMYGFTAVFEPIASEFGWSYAQVSLAASLRGMEAGLLAPLVGLLADRWGPRRLMVIGSFFSGLGLIFLSRITSLGMFYGAFILIATGVSTCTGAILMTATANWFRRKVGIASGIILCGFGFSGLLIPAVVALVDIFGWRPAMVILGVGVWVIVMPLTLLFRHKPEQYGYVPDGEVSDIVIPDEGMTPAPAADKDIGVKQALRSSAFWHIALPFFKG